jgi:hypothetical protein
MGGEAVPKGVGVDVRLGPGSTDRKPQVFGECAPVQVVAM